MPDSYTALSGWAKHKTFGLRKDWLRLYIDHPDDWMDAGALGNRQVESLHVWLRTTGLLDQHGTETWLCDLFRERGFDEPYAWECLWVNVVFNFPPANWYVRELGLGQWTTVQLRQKLSMSVGRLAPRTVSSGILELIGLLERTPVGDVLKQGEVTPSHPRVVNRRGLETPSSEALSFAVRRLFAQQKTDCLSLNQDLPWPWTIFGCKKEDAILGLVLSGDDRLVITDAAMRVIAQ